MSLSIFLFKYAHATSHLFYMQMSSSDLCYDSFCQFNIICAKSIFSKIRQFLDCNEACVEKGVALSSKRNKKTITVLQFFENSKKNQ